MNILFSLSFGTVIITFLPTTMAEVQPSTFLDSIVATTATNAPSSRSTSTLSPYYSATNAPSSHSTSIESLYYSATNTPSSRSNSIVILYYSAEFYTREALEPNTNDVLKVLNQFLKNELPSFIGSSNAMINELSDKSNIDSANFVELTINSEWRNAEGWCDERARKYSESHCYPAIGKTEITIPSLPSLLDYDEQEQNQKSAMTSNQELTERSNSMKEILNKYAHTISLAMENIDGFVVKQMTKEELVFSVGSNIDDNNSSTPPPQSKSSQQDTLLGVEYVYWFISASVVVVLVLTFSAIWIVRKHLNAEMEKVNANDIQISMTHSEDDDAEIQLNKYDNVGMLCMAPKVIEDINYECCEAFHKSCCSDMYTSYEASVTSPSVIETAKSVRSASK